MNKFLNIVLKGLATSFVTVLIGGILFLNIRTSPNVSMVLVSSSVFNSLKTNSAKKEDVKVEEVKIEEEVVELKEEKEEDKKEEKIEEVKEEKKEEVVETPKQEEQPRQEEKSSIPGAKGSYAPNMEAVNNATVTSTFSGKMTAYGADCDGCGSGETAAGVYVGDGHIYYNHPTYGSIRIVAGDRSILRKVVKISGVNLYSDPVVAIVLDTGGDIGFNKPKGIVLDLLFPSEHTPEAANFGQQHVTVEVLN